MYAREDASMKKILTLLITLVILAFVVTACGSSNETEQANAESETESEVEQSNDSEDQTNDLEQSSEQSSSEKVVINVGAPKAPPIIPILRMKETNALGENVEIKLNFWETPEQLIAMIQGNESQMYAFPLSVIAKLYNKGMGVKLTNVNTWGVAYLVSSNDEVNTWEDLKGKKLYVSLQSSPPDIMTQYFLKESGLEKSDCEIVYVAKTELAHMMIAGKVENAVTIEPLVSMVTTKNPDMKVKIAFQEQWNEFGNDGKIPTAGIGTTNLFAEENHDLIVQFEEEYAKALEWIVANPEQAGELAEKYLDMKKPIIIKALPNMGMHYTKAIDAKPELDVFYQLLFDFDPKTVGGKIPDEDMYFK